MNWILRLFLGYLTIELVGEYPEQILTLCAKRGILLWKTYSKKRRIRTDITINDFKRLRMVVRGQKTRVHIVGRYGIPFAINRRKKRLGFFLGVIVYFVILFVLQSFIWTVNVSGNKNINTNEILKKCEDMGISEGMRKDKINPKDNKIQLLLSVDSLAWASFNVEGSVLTVNISEIRDLKSIDNQTPTNIKSTADGIIKKIDISSGNSVVRVGDAVSKGDLLVSGIVENAVETQFVHSTGVVIADTERHFEFIEDYNQTLKVKTGKSKEKSVLYCFGLKVPLYLGVEQQTYVAHGNENRLKLFGNKLPISMYTAKFEYTEDKDFAFSKKELVSRLEAKLSKEIENLNLPEYEIVNKQFFDTENGVGIKADITAEENIACQDILIFNSGN